VIVGITKRKDNAIMGSALNLRDKCCIDLSFPLLTPRFAPREDRTPVTGSLPF
jgi:hypothetical protein